MAKIDKKTKKQMTRVEELLSRVSARMFEKTFSILAEYDKKFGKRIFIQVFYNSLCTRSQEDQVWAGRKWYLSSHMLDDEIIKTAYAAFRAAVEHEVMEAFKVDDKTLFNPHTSFEELLTLSDKEVAREKPKKPKKHKKKGKRDGDKIKDEDNSPENGYRHQPSY